MSEPAPRCVAAGIAASRLLDLPALGVSGFRLVPEGPPPLTLPDLELVQGRARSRST